MNEILREQYKETLEKFVDNVLDVYSEVKDSSISLAVGESLQILNIGSGTVIKLHSYDKFVGFSDSFPILIPRVNLTNNQRIVFKPVETLDPITASLRINTIENASAVVTHLFFENQARAA